MPDKPKTPHRSIRVPTPRWDQAGDNTAALGVDRSAWINDALAWLNREPGAKQPKRPAVDRDSEGGDEHEPTGIV